MIESKQTTQFFMKSLFFFLITHFYVYSRKNEHIQNGDIQIETGKTLWRFHVKGGSYNNAASGVCFQPVRVLPMYWTVKPGQEEGHHWSNFPCFIDTRGEQVGAFHCYGLPCLEYPGLFKVGSKTRFLVSTLV